MKSLACHTFAAKALISAFLVTALATCMNLSLQAQTLAEGVSAVDECVQKLDKNQWPAPVAQALALEQSFVAKVLLQEGWRVSDLVFIKALAQKSGVKPEQLLAENPSRDWPAAMKKAGLSEAEMARIMDDAYADLALKMLDFPKKKEPARRTAKS